MSAGTKQVMAMIAGGIFGTMCLIGMLILLNRRLFDKRISKTSKFSDTFVKSAAPVLNVAICCAQFAKATIELPSKC
jgi:nitrate reductase gamma subunit